MLRRILTITVALLFAGAATAAPRSVAWNNTVTLSAAGGYVVGNPDAKVRVTQFVSYSCRPCSTFVIQSEGPLRIAYIGSGKVSFEVRPLIMSPIDLAVSMLVQCGPKERFFLNHMALLRGQNRWLDKMGGFNPSQTVRWGSGTLAQRNRAIANDFDLYSIMESRGYERIETDRCLADQARATSIEAQSKAAGTMGVVSAPSFAINGTLLKDTATWAQLRPQIDKSL